MMKTMTMIRTSAAAIAAATVLSPGSALAQEVDPATTVAVPLDTAPTPTAEPVVSDTPIILPTVEETAVPETTSAPSTSAPVTTRRTTSAPTSSPAPAATTSAPSATTDVSSAQAIATGETVEAVPPLTMEPQPASTPSVTSVDDDLLPIAAGAGAGLLALLGFGMALRRQRGRESGASLTPAAITRPASDAPVAIPTAPAREPRPVFAFDRQVPASVAAPMAATSGNRIEQALKGPTPDNPFLSLKKRLKRAAFFEQRERQLRRGTGARVSPMAGLPERLVERLTARNTPRYQPA